MDKNPILLKQVIIADPQVSYDGAQDILIENGVITAISREIPAENARVIDGAGRLVVFPGLFDMHVHLRDPGFTHKEDILTGTDAAKAGGFTAVACMPNTKPVLDAPELVRYIEEKSAHTGVKVYPVTAITKGMRGDTLADFDALVDCGVKAISDDGRPVENAELMRKALELSVKNGLTVISHCEDLSIINGGIINKGAVSEALGVRGMDRASEDSITAREIALAMSCGAHIHIAHVSTAGSVNIIRAAKADGVRVTCETCPHYFTYTDEKLLTRDADYRMSPPLRTEADRAAVEAAVIDGTIDCIVTDHAPHTAAEKADFEKAPNGVVGLETSLAMTLTKLYHTGKLTLAEVAQRMSVAPRKILGIAPLAVAPGMPADLTVADPDLCWEVIAQELHSKSKNTVFKGEICKGKVLYTISAGKLVFAL
ncbi:MAG: dihydroorotase [Oscillospiraceae bacterium]